MAFTPRNSQPKGNDKTESSGVMQRLSGKPSSQDVRSVVRPAVQKFGFVTIRYTGMSAIGVLGKVSGRRYHFSRVRPQQPVDARDAPALLSFPYMHQER